VGQPTADADANAAGVAPTRYEGVGWCHGDVFLSQRSHEPFLRPPRRHSQPGTQRQGMGLRDMFAQNIRNERLSRSNFLALHPDQVLRRTILNPSCRDFSGKVGGAPRRHAHDAGDSDTVLGRHHEISDTQAGQNSLGETRDEKAEIGQ